jgi:hypothetical protein
MSSVPSPLLDLQHSLLAFYRGGGGVVRAQEAKYIERWPNTTSAGLPAEDLIFQWIGMVEYIPFLVLQQYTGASICQQENIS